MLNSVRAGTRPDRNLLRAEPETPGVARRSHVRARPRSSPTCRFNRRETAGFDKPFPKPPGAESYRFLLEVCVCVCVFYLEQAEFLLAGCFTLTFWACCELKAMFPWLYNLLDFVETLDHVCTF